MKTETKDHKIVFRCDKQQLQAIQAKADLANRSISDYCRIAALKSRVVAINRLSEVEIECFKALQTHNLNFAKLGNYIRANYPHLASEISNHLEESKQIINRFLPKQ